jgi:plastocyanin domain-containing protein
VRKTAQRFDGGRLHHANDVHATLNITVTSPSESAYKSGDAMKLLSFALSLFFVGAAIAEPKTKELRIAIQVTKRGFEPDNITVPAREPVILEFTRKTDATCTKTVVLTLDDGKKLQRDLPLDKPVEIAVTFSKAGKLTYACSMDMTKGTIVVQ